MTYYFITNFIVLIFLRNSITFSGTKKIFINFFFLILVQNIWTYVFFPQAYSVYDDEIGYCQGQSFLAAVLLLHVSIWQE